MNRLMKRNAQIILDWKQLHHEMLKLRGYVKWWGAAMKWETRKNSWSRDSASSDFHMYVRNDLIFCRYATIRLWLIALRSIRIVNLLISKWSRFAAQWRIDLLILRRWSWDQAFQTRSYEDDRWVKHSRHDRVEDDRARRALNEKVKSSWERRSRSQMNLDRWVHRWVFENWNFYTMRWIFHLDLADRDSNSFFSPINKIRQTVIESYIERDDVIKCELDRLAFIEIWFIIKLS
jgi:hypothetical protein